MVVHVGQHGGDDLEVGTVGAVAGRTVGRGRAGSQWPVGGRNQRPAPEWVKEIDTVSQLPQTQFSSVYFLVS